MSVSMSGCWSVAAGSVAGPSHVAAGSPNQDAVQVRVDGDVVVLAVCDGAGSLADSHVGAALAASTAADVALSFARMAVTAVDSVCAAVDEARRVVLEHPSRPSVGCTLAVVVASLNGWAVGLVGDSFAVVSMVDGSHVLVESPPAGEFVNITALLTSADPPVTVRSGGSAGVLAVSVASDGLAHTAIGADGPHAGFWDPLVARCAAGELDVAALLGHMDRSGLLEDDSTLAVAAFAGA